MATTALQDANEVGATFRRFQQETNGDVLAASILTHAAIIAGQSGQTPADRLFDVPKAAARLSVSERTVRELVAAGKLDCVRIGKGRGKILFSNEHLTSFLENTEGVPTLKSTSTKQRRYLGL